MAAMSEHEHEPSTEQVHHRADQLLPEEQVAGTADPDAQAEAILEESEERTAYESGDEPHGGAEARGEAHAD